MPSNPGYLKIIRVSPLGNVVDVCLPNRYRFLEKHQVRGEKQDFEFYNRSPSSQ